ncbi:MAG: TlpA family protein disulfide reductase [Pseudolabrys sp.]|nr:TlpA family protein disulfide reductase [Pseudolabrys sp.]
MMASGPEAKRPPHILLLISSLPKAQKMSDPSPSGFGKNRLTLIVAACLAGGLVGLAGVYGIATLTRNAPGPAAKDAACAPAVELAKKVAPFARGEVAAVNVAKSPLMLPDLAFQDASGAARSLADFRGRTVLLNLWATWCVPCRKEMPALDALERKLGGPGFEVVAVNIDTRDPEKPKAFLKEIGVSNLNYYADSNAKAFQDLKSIGRAFGMPTTLLVDPQGCEIGTIAGPAEWASDDAIKLIEAALKGVKSGG